MNEAYRVEVDTFSGLLTTLGSPRKERITEDLSKKWGSVESCIAYLEREGLLSVGPERDDHGSYTIQLTHSGFHYAQTVISAFLKFLAKSVLVPIAVAFVTTLITLWVKRVLGADMPV